MHHWRLVIAALIATLSFYTASAGAEEHTSRPARKDEIVGFWQLVPLPESLRPKVLSTDPWPSSCQWFGYYSDGVLKTIDKLRGPCDEFTAKKLAETMNTVPSIISWEHHEPALAVVSRSDAKNYAEGWEVTLVLKAFSKNGAEFAPGDIVMYLRNFKENKTLYIRHLKRLLPEL
jgi:hypothetical protein